MRGLDNPAAVRLVQSPMSPLRIADRTFASRLLTGTGKYASAAQLRTVLDACGAEVVTMAIKRIASTGVLGMITARWAVIGTFAFSSLAKLRNGSRLRSLSTKSVSR